MVSLRNGPGNCDPALMGVFLPAEGESCRVFPRVVTLLACREQEMDPRCFSFFFFFTFTSGGGTAAAVQHFAVGAVKMDLSL